MQQVKRELRIRVQGFREHVKKVKQKKKQSIDKISFFFWKGIEKISDMPPKDIFLAEKEAYQKDPVTKVVIIFLSPRMVIWPIIHNVTPECNKSNFRTKFL